MVKQAPALKLGFIFLFLLSSIHSFAQSYEQDIFYNGQESEVLELSNQLIETRYRTEMQDSICYRQVPYQDQECETVPDYDTRCETIPGRNDCRTEYDRQCRTETDYRRECSRGRDRQECRNETRYKKECSQGPSRRQCRNVRRTRQECHMDHSQRNCRTEPSREICRTATNGERRCRTIPSREICENKPQRVCRDVPYNDEVCENIPGEMTCRQVPYQERVCHTVPGEQTCRNVPYSNEVCNNVPRQVCDWIPPRQDCRTVQVGSHQECRDVTRYRQESYACKKEVRVPYTVVLKNIALDGQINFVKQKGYNGDFGFKTLLTQDSEVQFQIDQIQGISPLILVDRDEKKEIQGKDEKITATYSFDIFNGDKIIEELNAIKEVILSKKTFSFSFKDISLFNDFSFNLKIYDDEQVLVNKVISKDEYIIKKIDDQLNVQVLLEKLNVKLKTLHKYSYSLKIIPSFQTEKEKITKLNFEGKKAGQVFSYDEDELNRLKRMLNNLSDLSLSEDSLQFVFPNHDFISGANFYVRIGNLIDRRITTDEFQWKITKENVLVKIDLRKLGLDLNVLDDYLVTVKVDYEFDENSPLPSGFSHIAQMSKSSRPVVGEKSFERLKESIEFLEDVELKKYGMSFKIKDENFIESFKLHVEISKRGKVKFEKYLSSEELTIDKVGSFKNVSIDFEKFDSKISKFGKHDVKLRINYILKEGVTLPLEIDLNHSVQIELKAK